MATGLSQVPLSVPHLTFPDHNYELEQPAIFQQRQKFIHTQKKAPQIADGEEPYTALMLVPCRPLA